jgi:hypothetical protein
MNPAHEDWRLDSLARRCFAGIMQRSRVILALVLVAIWITTVFHVGLEANGWIPEHEHRGAHAHPDEDVPHHDQAAGDTEHEPVFARSSLQEGRSIAWLWLLCVPAIGMLFWFCLSLRPRLVEIRPPPRWREALAISSWLFAWRCASFTTAPPALR